MPVYLVKAPDGDRLINAVNKTAAVNFVVGEAFPAEAVTTSGMVELMESGMVVEQAAKKAAPEIVEEVPEEETNDAPTTDYAPEEVSEGVDVE